MRRLSVLLLSFALPLFAVETIVPEGVDARLVRAFSEADASYEVDAEGDFVLDVPIGRQKRQRVRVSGPTQVGAGGIETRRISSVAYLDERRPDPDALALVLADRPVTGNRDVRRWEVGKTDEGLHRVAFVREIAGGASPQYLMEAIDEVALRAARGGMRLSAAAGAD